MSAQSSLREVVIFAPHQLAEITTALKSALFDAGPPLLVLEEASWPTDPLQVPREVALVVATSGSTGSVKYVLHSASTLLASANATHAYLDAQPGERWALRLPLTHIAGLMVLVRSLLLNSPLSENGEYQAVVPTQLFRALRGDETLAPLKNAKAVLVGGGPSDVKLIEEARAAGIKAITTYGMSETAGGCVYNGRPLTGVKILLDSAQQIFVSGPQVALGYLHDSTGFQDGGFLTQDIGQWREDGLLEILGRADDIVISGGQKILLGAIEERIRSMPGVIDVHLFTRKSAEWGDEVVCAVAGGKSITLSSIRDHVAERFPRSSAPRALILLAELPLRGIGKPDRDTLKTLPLTEEI